MQSHFPHIVHFYNLKLFIFDSALSCKEQAFLAVYFLYNTTRSDVVIILKSNNFFPSFTILNESEYIYCYK